MRITRWITALASLLALTFVLPLDVGAQANPRYWLQVRGDDGSVITSGYCRPLNEGLNTEPTIYTTSTLGTTKSIPITINSTNGECEWYSTRGLTYDVMVYVTAGNYKGAVIRLDAFTGVGVAIAGRSHGTTHLVVPFSATGSTSTQTASETVNGGMLIQDVIVETKTAVAGSNFLVGLATYSNTEFCNAVSTGSVGFVDCNPTRFMLHSSGALAIVFHNQNHASAGYIHVYGKSAGNTP